MTINALAIAEKFEKCIKRKESGLIYKIDCILGLWGVEGGCKEVVETEAFHYWQQYESDGEYSSIIGGQSVIEKLKQQLT